MRSVLKLGVPGLVVTVAVLCLAPAAGAATARRSAVPAVSCAGQARTLNWSAPSEVEGLTGYFVQQELYNDVNQGGTVWTSIVPVTQTSLEVDLPFGVNRFFVFADTAAGPVGDPIAEATWEAGRAPFAAELTGIQVARQQVTVDVSWPGPVSMSTTGLETDTLTVSIGGRRATVTPFDGQATVSVAGLRDGDPYVVQVVTSNVCGAADPVVSTAVIPGVRARLLPARPPLRLTGLRYEARLRAVGDPQPTWRLRAAPRWIHLSRHGRDAVVRGMPPRAVSSFCSSVVVSNDVGAPPSVSGGAQAGPFRVTVIRHRSRLSHRDARHPMQARR